MLASLQEMLCSLTQEERLCLQTIVRLMLDFDAYHVLREDDLYTSIEPFSFEQVASAVSALRDKGLIEVQDDGSTVTRILCLSQLNDKEQRILCDIVAFQHCVPGPVRFHNVEGNVRNVSVEGLKTILQTLAQQGFITLKQDFTVGETFCGVTTQIASPRRGLPSLL